MPELAKREPAVSVVALCFNHGRFVRQCLESISAQTFRDFELIVMDDCSSDDSVALIEAWIAETGSACRFIAHTTNQGICRSLNEAVAMARARLITMVATDDLWLPDKLADQVTRLAELPDDVAVIYSDAYQIAEDGTRLEQMFMQSYAAPVPAPEGAVFDHLVASNFIPAVTPMMRRKCLVEVGPYDESLCYEDWDMWLRLSSRFRFAFSEYIGASYRIVGTSVTRTLLSKWGRPQVFTAMRIAAKLVDSGRLQGAALRKKRAELTRFAWRLCAMGDARSTEHLELALRLDPKLGTRVLLFMARRASSAKAAVWVAQTYFRVRSNADWRISQLQSLCERASTWTRSYMRRAGR